MDVIIHFLFNYFYSHYIKKALFNDLSELVGECNELKTQIESFSSQNKKVGVASFPALTNMLVNDTKGKLQGFKDTLEESANQV